MNESPSLLRWLSAATSFCSTNGTGARLQRILALRHTARSVQSMACREPDRYGDEARRTTHLSRCCSSNAPLPSTCFADAPIVAYDHRERKGAGQGRAAPNEVRAALTRAFAPEHSHIGASAFLTSASRYSPRITATTASTILPCASSVRTPTVSVTRSLLAVNSFPGRA